MYIFCLLVTQYTPCGTVHTHTHAHLQQMYYKVLSSRGHILPINSEDLIPRVYATV